MQQRQFFPLGGGLDLISPAIAVPPGRAIAAANYEPHDRGYRRIDGLERFDGRAKPSEASYWILDFDTGDTDVVADTTVTGGTSGATGVALVDAVVESGSYGGSDAAGYLVLTAVSGTFVTGEDIEVSASQVSNAVGTAVSRGADNDTDDATWLQGAIERARNQIERVPGFGPVRGVWTFDGEVWAIRDNASSPTSSSDSCAASGDDANEVVGGVSAGTVSIVGTTIGFQSDRTSGFRFQTHAPSQGAAIISSSIQFTAATTKSDAIKVRIYGELTDDAAVFAATDLNVSGRTKTTAFVDWTIPAWTAGDRTSAQVTPDLSEIVQEIVDQAAWVANNDLAFIVEYVSGGGSRVVAPFDHATLTEPTLSTDWATVLNVDIAQLYKATTSGWTAQSLGRELAFTSGGTTEIVEGDTITGATSAATAEVTRVTLESGSWAAGTAAGRFIFASQTGTFQSENIDVGASLNLATIAGDSSAISIANGGRYDFVNHNFFGSSDLERMYGAGGVDYGFEWDGTVFVPIHTGLSASLDKPTRVAVHKNHLFLAYAGGHVQNSATGLPYNWEAAGGAAEIGLGEDVTGLLDSVQGALVVFGVGKIGVLYGSDSSDFVFDDLANDAGAEAWTAQMMDVPLYLDKRGVRSLSATQDFGNFRRGTVTELVEPLIRAKLKAGVTAAGSLRVRAKDQYRLFWSDGTGLTVSLLKAAPEILPFDIDIVPTATCSGEDDDNKEILLIGDGDGWVYQVDAGTSLDGAAVSAFIRLPFNHVGGPTYDKRWHKVTLEVDAGPTNTIGLIPEFSYADPDQPPGQELEFSVRGGGGFWGEDTWNDIYWSSPVEGLAEAHIDGIGRNVSVVAFSSETYAEPHAIHGLTLHYSPRRMLR